ncbi:hypothetical protein Ddc_24105 [Ditylenchus destructor]|nr:hypothetical protein Ddc_24105 [Ditylenchus destructor]
MRHSPHRPRADRTSDAAHPWRWLVDSRRPAQVSRGKVIGTLFRAHRRADRQRPSIEAALQNRRAGGQFTLRAGRAVPRGQDHGAGAISMPEQCSFPTAQRGTVSVPTSCPVDGRETRGDGERRPQAGAQGQERFFVS